MSNIDVEEFPLVTIVIPVFIDSNYTAEIIQSCIKQKYTNLEILVVKGSSTDNGLTESTFCPSLNDNRVKYFLKPNGCVSDWLCNKANHSVCIPKYHIETILNGIGSKQLFYDIFKSENNYKKTFFYVLNFQVCRHLIKGCKTFLRIVEQRKKFPIQFYMVGDNRYNFDFSKYDIMIYLGKIIDKNTMRQIYSGCDMTLIASKMGTFDLVTAESLCCGTKVFGFETGWSESILIPNYSLFLPKTTQLESFIDNLVDFLSKEFDKKELSKVAKEKYDFEKIGKQYLKQYYRMVEN